MALRRLARSEVAHATSASAAESDFVRYGSIGHVAISVLNSNARSRHLRASERLGFTPRTATRARVRASKVSASLAAATASP